MSMTDDEIIAIVQHQKNGGEVEWRPAGRNGSWIPKDPGALWDFVWNEYRPKPADKVLYYNQRFLMPQGRPYREPGDIAITFDAESGQPKKIEVVK